MPALTRDRHNLPAQVSSFIGRERELDEIARLLRAHRLITLTGSGGTGKTRLALQAAEAELDHFGDGVWLVELAPLTTADLVLGTLAKAVAAPEAGTLEPLDALGVFLGQKQVLLVLDNCEHLLGECARVVAALLARCPALTVLATSREPLMVNGEAVLRVPPLSFPDTAQPLERERLLDYGAVRLFVERAHAAEQSFQLTSVTAAPIVDICRRLDGIPLALELAAVRVRGMGVAYLGERLDDRFRLLTGGNRASEPRQRTLLALVDWSYGLLSERERAVLRRLCVFRGGFAADAAEAVCAGDYDDGRGRAPVSVDGALDDLTRLVDKSLVQFDHETGRYRLLETIHLYSLERLGESGETNYISRQHFVYFLHLAEGGIANIGSARQDAWFTRLEQEHDNFRAALGWAINAGRSDEAARMALGLWRFWSERTYQREGLRWLEQILALAETNPLPADLRPRLLNALGVLALMARYFDRARAYHDEALRLWTEAGDQAGMAQALIDIGWQHFQEVDLPQTKRRAVEGLALAERSGDKRLIASALLLNGLADLHADTDLLFRYGTDAKADHRSLLSVVSPLERSLAIWRELGDTGSEASVLGMLGFAYQGAGDFARAKPVLAESARLHLRLRSYGNLTGSLVALMNLAANASAGPEQFRDAARMFGALIALNETISAEPSPWDSSEPSQKLRGHLIEALGRDGYEQAFAEGKALTPAGLLSLVDRITAPDPGRAEPVRHERTAAPHDDLTAREREVLRLVSQGLTNAQIAHALTVTSRTVNAHLTSIYAKLGVASRGGAIRYAMSHHLD